MKLDTTDPNVTRVVYRPVFVPAFCAAFVVLGLWLLVAHTLEGSWSGQEAFGAAACLSIGGAGFLYSARRATFLFDHRARQLDWTRRTLLSREEGRIPFERIERAGVQRGPRPNDTTTRVVLFLTDGETLPLTEAYTAGDARQREVAHAIHSALEASRTSGSA